MSAPATVQAAALYAAACDLLAKYCRGIDSRDEELLAGLVTDDVELRTASGHNEHGRLAFIHYFRQVWASQTAPMMHQVTNIEAQSNGDRLSVRSRFTGLATREGGMFMAWGHYDDEMTLTTGNGLVFSAKRVFIAGTSAPA